MADWTDDYTRSRTIGVTPYAVEDKIGRGDGRDRVVTSTVTASSGIDLLPASPLGRRDHIKIKNVGSVDVAVLITNASGTTAAEGFIVSADGGEWEDSTDGTFYITSTGADSEVRVYERSSR